jgi:GDPmannose 4,6-dehydratase
MVLQEKCIDNFGNVLIECDPAYQRPLEVDTLLGDASKARKYLNWKPSINLKSLVKEMVVEELSILNGKKK